MVRQTISAAGEIRLDIDDVELLEQQGIFDRVILHEMGHVIGIGCVAYPRRVRVLSRRGMACIGLTNDL